MGVFANYQQGLLGAEAFGHRKPSAQDAQVQQAISFQDQARRLVYDYIVPRLEKTDTHVEFDLSEVYAVWFTYVLRNWKCLISTTLPDGMYYEVTHNADKGETYIDAYKKFDNVCVKD